MEACIRCREHPANTGGLCVRCMFVVRSEAQRGIERLGRYLAAWAMFRQYEQNNRPVA